MTLTPTNPSSLNHSLTHSLTDHRHSSDEGNPSLPFFGRPRVGTTPPPLRPANETMKDWDDSTIYFSDRQLKW
jgi:hypothetical protein